MRSLGQTAGAIDRRHRRGSGRRTRRQWRGEYSPRRNPQGSQDDAGNWPLSRTLRQQVSHGMADHTDGAHSRHLIGRKHSEFHAVADGERFAPVPRLEFRCCRQPNRVSIATPEYVGVWRLYFALFGTWLQGPSFPSTISASPPSANGASAPYPRRIALRVLLEIEAATDVSIEP